MGKQSITMVRSYPKNTNTAGQKVYLNGSSQDVNGKEDKSKMENI